MILFSIKTCSETETTYLISEWNGLCNVMQNI